MVATKEQKHARPVAVVVFCVAGIMLLLLVAAGRYCASAATTAAASTGLDGSNSIASVVSVQRKTGSHEDTISRIETF